MFETIGSTRATPSTASTAAMSSSTRSWAGTPGLLSKPEMPVVSSDTLTSASAPRTRESKLEDSMLVNISEPATKATPSTIDSALMIRRSLRAQTDLRVARSMRQSSSARRAMERSAVDSSSISSPMGPCVGALPPSR